MCSTFCKYEHFVLSVSTCINSILHFRYALVDFGLAHKVEKRKSQYQTPANKSAKASSDKKPLCTSKQHQISLNQQVIS